MDNATIWKILDTYFHDNPQALVRHHIDSYNDFYKNGIYQIFKEKNPIRLYSRPDPKNPGEYLSECNLYIGGKGGDKLYFGKPVISDDANSHYMYPNEARLRNMTYGMTIHYDVDVEIIHTLRPGEAPKMFGGLGDDDDDIDGFIGGGPKKRVEITPSAAKKIREDVENTIGEDGKQVIRHTLKHIYLGKFPVMVQSDFCILQGLSREVRFTMGECRNDVGGYFIIDGKEKTIVAQEKFANNILNVHKVGNDDYTYVAEMISVSEDVSKPVRRLSVGLCADKAKYKGGNIVVNIPNVRKPVPLFIVFRALGIVSDKDIISYCLLDIEQNEGLVDLFIPSVHDSATILTQETALNYIRLLIKKASSTAQVLHILSDYFLPHVGDTNYISKAYSLGWIVNRLIKVSRGMEVPTDRDSFKCKRIELVGELLSELFREYWNIQLRAIQLGFEKRLYYNVDMYEDNLYGLITDNYLEIFKERLLETGFRKAYKGNWGAQSHTKRIGIVQDLNRLSFNSALNHLRKTNLPLDSSVKLVGPRVLHNSQWGFLDPIDTPDGGSIGLHKHLSISTYVTRGVSREPMINWLREKWGMKRVEEFSPIMLSAMTKVIINGYWAGVVDSPIECVRKFKLYRRNALLPIYASVTFEIAANTIYIYTDAGRVCRPIFYQDDETGRASYQNKGVLKYLQTGHFTWEQLVSGFNKKRDSLHFDATQMNIYELNELYEGIETETNPTKLERFMVEKAVFDYIDAVESDTAMIALNTEDFEKSDSKYTHCEIHNSLILGMMCNMIIFPENNPATRNSFSCGQSKQAASLYHTNYQSRMDKTAVVLNHGQIPLVKSRFLDFITHEENSYGENAIVAIACYTGYNVEDAILINEGSLKRGLFRTSYFTTYEGHEEISSADREISGSSETTVSKKFMNIQNEEIVLGTKPGYDYSKLDMHGIIKQGTLVDDKTVLIGMATVSTPPAGSAIIVEPSYTDASKTPKKGQLGVVERAFITESEEGKRIAKVRIVEQRIPTIGDKMASRAGQKGTIGLVIPEQDMPFTAEGIRPDMIINPHAIPSRMTIGQLVECVTGKASLEMGGFGDCTAFNNLGSKIQVFGEILPKFGYHSSGNEILYNGMTGEQMQMEIFMGPTYYMRLKHMVKDKINYRALGPRTALTKQPVSGRANDGGLRIGEMERDTVISHGMSDFLRESMMERGDKSYLAVCNKTGLIAIYNEERGLFMSPMADGPIRFTSAVDGNQDMRIEHITKYGRSFSLVCIPYSFKLMIQELQTMNVQLRIITEDNIDQMENMAYSHNIDLLAQEKDVNPKMLFTTIKMKIRSLMENKKKRTDVMSSSPSLQRHDDFYGNFPNNGSPDYPDVSPAYVPPFEEREHADDSETYSFLNSPIIHEARSPDFPPPMTPSSPDFPPPRSPDFPPPRSPDFPPPEMYGGSGTNNNSDEESHEYVKGDVVYLRNTGMRRWKINHVGDDFVGVEAIDREGLTDTTMVVNKNDILGPDEINVYHEPSMEYSRPPQMQNVIPQYHPNANVQYPSLTPSPVVVNFAPKIFNHGNDQSVTPLENHEQSMPLSNISTLAHADEGKETDNDSSEKFNKPMIVVKKHAT